MLAGEGHVGQDAVLADVHQVCIFGPARAQLFSYLAPSLAGMSAVGMDKDLPDSCSNDGLLPVRDTSQCITCQYSCTAWTPSSSRCRSAPGLHQFATRRGLRHRHSRLLDHSHQRLFRGLASSDEAGEVAALPKLRHPQVAYPLHQVVRSALIRPSISASVISCRIASGMQCRKFHWSCLASSSDRFMFVLVIGVSVGDAVEVAQLRLDHTPYSHPGITPLAAIKLQ